MFKKVPLLLTPNTTFCSFLLFLGFVFMGFVFIPASPILADEVTLAWSANQETDLAGYRLYFNSGQSGPPYEGGGIDGKSSPIDIPLSALADAGQPEYRLTGLSPDTAFYFVVTAYTTSELESDFSNEVTYKTAKAVHTITAQAGANGSISPVGSIEVSDGGSQQFSIAPHTGYHVIDVVVDGNAIGPDTGYTFSNVTADHTISAVFGINTYVVSANTEENGTISPSGQVTVSYGQDQTFAIVPAAGYQIADVIVDGGSVGALSTYTLSNIQGNHKISASFAPITSNQEGPPKGVTIETGEVLIDHNWQRIELKKSFTAPVVVAGPLTATDDAPAVVRIQNVDSSGFDIRVQEWNYMDGLHNPETVGYLVMERGSFTLDNGFLVEAGVIETDKTSTFGNIQFARPFQDTPVVMTSIVSFNGSDTVGGRMRNIQKSGFDYCMQEQEGKEQAHVSERVAYIAWEPSSGIVDGLSYEVNSTGNAVTQKFKSIALAQDFLAAPVFIADMQTSNGFDTANVRARNKTTDAVEVQIDEEQSKDNEVNHAREAVGYIALSTAFSLADTDEDGINDLDELNLYHTDPKSADSDADGISDGDERDYWGDAWNEDADGDGAVNLLDPDADDDGIFDGEEIANGTDPGVAEPAVSPIVFGDIKINHEWTRVALDQAFVDPVVVAGPLSFYGSNASLIRIRNVDSSGFEIRIQEWDYLDGSHVFETVSYMVMEKGCHTLENGTKVEAGTVTATGNGGFAPMQFTHEFQSTPVVFMAVISVNEADAVTHRIRNITAKGAEYRLQEQQANAQVHAAETLSYIAWEPSSGVLGPYAYEVGRTGNEVTDAPYNIMVAEPSGKMPFFLADMQTQNGADTANLRLDNKDPYSVDIFVNEEGSFDEEISHISEVVGYIFVLPLN